MGTSVLTFPLKSRSAILESLISGEGPRDVMPAFLYVYVENADSTYQRALAAGAQSLEEPRDLPYGDRRGMVKDRWGNVWQIATRIS